MAPGRASIMWFSIGMMGLVAPILIVAWLYGAPTAIDEFHDKA
jgi:hypothetical protein